MWFQALAAFTGSSAATTTLHFILSTRFLQGLRFLRSLTLFVAFRSGFRRHCHTIAVLGGPACEFLQSRVLFCRVRIDFKITVRFANFGGCFECDISVLGLLQVTGHIPNFASSHKSFRVVCLSSVCVFHFLVTYT